MPQFVLTSSDCIYKYGTENLYNYISKLNKQLINPVVCTPTTNHTRCCTILLTVITLKDCFVSCDCCDKQSHVQWSKRWPLNFLQL